MFKTFFVGGQLWFQSNDTSVDDLYCYPVALIQLSRDRSSCFFRSNSIYSTSGTETGRGTAKEIPITSLPTYTSKFSDQENFNEYLKFLFRNF